jgi:GxxExxY protein
MHYEPDKYPYQQESYEIIGACMEVHRILGKGFAEIVYKDALSYEFRCRGIPFEREKEYPVEYKKVILPHKFYADFVVFEKIILEVKAQKGIAEEQYAQVINYLAVSGCKLGLLVNFGESSLVVKRIVLSRT